MKPKYFLPLLGFAVPTVVIGYGDVLLAQLEDETVKSKVRTMKAAGDRAAT